MCLLPRAAMVSALVVAEEKQDVGAASGPRRRGRDRRGRGPGQRSEDSRRSRRSELGRLSCVLSSCCCRSPDLPDPFTCHCGQRRAVSPQSCGEQVRRPLSRLYLPEQRSELYSTRGGLTQARSASDGTVPSLVLRACVNPPRVEYSSPLQGKRQARIGVVTPRHYRTAGMAVG